MQIYQNEYQCFFSRRVIFGIRLKNYKWFEVYACSFARVFGSESEFESQKIINELNENGK